MKNLFNFILQILGLRPAFTQTSLEERACLGRHATNRRRLVEIGVYQGVTTRVLRTAMSMDGVICAVDPCFKNRLGICFYEIIARREVAAVPRGQVVWIKMLGKEALASAELKAHAPFDFAFIDGDHSYEGIRGDWEGLLPLLAPGAIVALHDSRESGNCGSERFTNEVILPNPNFRVVETCGVLTVLEKSAAPSA